MALLPSLGSLASNSLPSLAFVLVSHCGGRVGERLKVKHVVADGFSTQVNKSTVQNNSSNIQCRNCVNRTSGHGYMWISLL